jgi:2-desacetyl-2-hydroxyethyl bacteriochlorophyllide A dehydrogenase
VTETSVVIRAYNEEKHLPVLFDGLERQAYQDFEAIVVDSGSFDHTREIARRRADRLVTIKPEDFTFGHSLNVGVQAGQGRFIVIVSAHTEPTGHDWLEKLVAPLADARTAMVYGRQIGPPGSKFSECLDFERTFGPRPKVLVPPEFFANNANSAVRRDLWEQHPFDERLPGLEDIEWAKYWMECGYRVVYAPEAGIYHIHQETWLQVRSRYYREGQAAWWIGVQRRREIPVEVLREAGYLVGDLAEAFRQRRLLEKAGEIARFRYEKLVGKVGGIWNGATTENPMKRERLLFNRSYRAVVIRGPGRAALENLELPPLKPSEVLVRVAYEGVCATDLEVLSGELSYYKSGLARYPIVPGHEFSGEVAAIGARVADLREGDPVVVESVHGCGACAACRNGNWISCVDRREVGVIARDGGYGEYMVTSVRFVHRVPAEVTLREACVCEPLAVVLKAIKRLERAWGTPGRRQCAVIGAGPIGHLAARVLAFHGHQVAVFDRNSARLGYFAGSGIRAEQGLSDLAGFDAVVEATGNADALDAAVRRSEAGTVLLLLGLPYGRRDFSFETIVGYDKIVVGSIGSSTADFAEALATLPKIEVKAFTQRVLPLAEFRQAWSLARTGEYLKVMLAVDPSRF